LTLDERQRHKAVLAVNRAIASAEDQAEILRLVVERAAEITGATACLLLLAGDDGLARVVRSTGIYPVLAADLAVPLSEHLDADLRARLGLKGEDGFVGAPVIGKAGLRGILAVYRRASQGGGDASDDEEVLSAFADQAAIALDNVESKRLLRRSEARFRAVADEAPVAIFEADANGRYVYFNPLAVKLLGAGPGDVWLDSIHPEDRERLEREWSHALAAGDAIASEYRLPPREGRTVLVQGHVSALRDPGGAVLGHVGAIVDITKNHFLGMQLALASRTASIGTLAASAAHQIERPLTSSILDQGVALDLARGARKRLMEGGPFDRDTALQVVGDMIRVLENAQADGRGLTRIVKQLTSYAQSAPGRIGVRLYDVVSQAIHWLPRSVNEAATIEIKNLAEQEVSASAGQIEQVIVNLVTNAARATKPGGRGKVTVQIGSGAPGMARIDVIDRGVGIVPSTLENIFHPFMRSGAAGKRMGLGLAISHAIVVSHAGTLTVTTALGQGSTFRVELPAVSARA
jgi:PAS domain S-box-containing protein